MATSSTEPPWTAPDGVTDEEILTRRLLRGVADPGPPGMAESGVGWLGSRARAWALYPFWPVLHVAAGILVDALGELSPAAAGGRAPVVADPDGVARSLLVSMAPDLLRLTKRAVADAGVRSTNEAGPGRDEESALAAELRSHYEPREVATAFLAARAPLVHLVIAVLARHIASFRLLLDRVRADWGEARTLVGPPSPTLDGARVAGDVHERGAVTILDLDRAPALVYKPRSLALDRGLAGLFEWLERHEPGLAPRVPRSIDRGTYGWQAFVPWRAARSRAEVSDFYRRMGALLAIAYALRANDLHYENVICDRGDPVLVDPECLFTATFGATADGVDEPVLGGTVLQVGMLPNAAAAVGPGAPLDFSPLGRVGRRRRMLPREELRRDDAGRLGFVSGDAHLPPPTYLPHRDDQTTSVRGFEQEIHDGFSRTYACLQRSKDELLSDAGPLSALRRCRVRHVLRPTVAYNRLLRELGRPDAARSVAEQEDVVGALPAPDGDDTVWPLVLAHERRGLLAGTVPTFERAVDGCDLIAGEAHLAGAFTMTGWDLVRQRLARLSDSDRSQQERLIAASLRLLRVHPRARAAKRYTPREATPPSRAELLAAATSIARQLDAQAVRSPSGTWWLVGRELDQGAYGLGPSALDLYRGLAGVALFAGYVELLTGHRLPALAEARPTMQREAERLVETRPVARLAHHGMLGAFDGLWGCVYTAASLGVSRGDRALRTWAEELASHLAAGVEEVRGWDLIGGTAGIAAVSAELARHGLGTTYAAVAERALDATAELVAPVLQRPAIPTGPAHGMAGVALAFDRGARLLSSAAYRQAASIALEAERSQCYWDERGWHDPQLEDRSVGAQARKGEGWCRGASGIGLSRAALLAAGPGDADPTGCAGVPMAATLREEIELAERVAAARAIGRDHCLCHGALGSVELFRWRAHRTTGGRQAPDEVGPAAAAARYLGGVVVAGCTRRWVTGLPASLPDPGLMTGLAGIGLGLLRAVDGDAVPLVLNLALPGRRPPSPDPGGAREAER